VSALRVLFITRRYWPLVGASPTAVGTLAAGVCQAGQTAVVLTPRWRAEWPSAMLHRGVQVVRWNLSAPRACGTWYLAPLVRWLRSHLRQFDVVCVSELKHEAQAAIAAAAPCGVPVVLRCEHAGLSGDCQWQLEARGGRRIKQQCMRAAALVATSRMVETELIAAGYPRDRIHRCENGVDVPPPRDERLRLRSRQHLAQADHRLHLPPTAPLVLFCGELNAAKGLPRLLEIWPRVLQHRPDARLWIVGTGPMHDELALAIRRLRLETHVLLPGTFDDPSELYRAADAFVYPVEEASTSFALLEALAHGLPVAASDVPGNRHVLADGRFGRLFAPLDAQALLEAVLALLQPAALPAPDAVRAHVERSFHRRTMQRWHLDLFSRLQCQTAAP
jgi:glycosyltransferase involved in cell wall biosynthesis